MRTLETLAEQAKRVVLGRCAPSMTLYSGQHMHSPQGG